MANPASAKPKAFRRTRVWVSSIIALALASMAATYVGYTDGGRSLELAVSDKLRAAYPLPDEPQTARVTTIEIDDAALGHPYGGRWIWPRIRQAEFIDALASLGPRLVVLDIEYSEPEQACVAYRAGADGIPQATILARPDETLRDSLVRAGNVLVPFYLYISGRPESGGGALAGRKVEIPPALGRYALDVPPEAARRLLSAE
ncbi:MAG: CHASE2 domain-containing protein, partial [Planctomycetes bacterium]|nr:CHASE2 domain-containing protein [Planctomycetota bacterium]